MTIQELAKVLSHSFEKIRPDGVHITLKEDAPKWCEQVVQAAHNDMLPDNYRYQAIREAAYAIADCSNPETDPPALEPDCYTYDLVAWLGSNATRAGYCDDVDPGMLQKDAGIIERIMEGQRAELYEVVSLVIDALRKVSVQS